MNPQLIKQALTKINTTTPPNTNQPPNPHILINTISRRVRQLSAPSAPSRPLIPDTTNQNLADIALQELIQNKITWEKTNQKNQPQQQPPPAA